MPLLLLMDPATTWTSALPPAIRVDQCVVRVQFTSNKFKFEVQPAFENSDGSFNYPDTEAESWKVTKPRQGITATKVCNDRASKNMHHLARMARAWKDTNGVVMGGLRSSYESDSVIPYWVAIFTVAWTAGTWPAANASTQRPLTRPYAWSAWTSSDRAPRRHRSAGSLVRASRRSF